MTEGQLIILLLTDIRDELRHLGALMVGGEPEATDECQHPDESRISLATPAQPQHWICNDCKYEHGVIAN